MLVILRRTQNLTWRQQRLLETHTLHSILSPLLTCPATTIWFQALAQVQPMQQMTMFYQPHLTLCYSHNISIDVPFWETDYPRNGEDSALNYHHHWSFCKGEKSLHQRCNTSQQDLPPPQHSIHLLSTMPWTKISTWVALSVPPTHWIFTKTDWLLVCLLLWSTYSLLGRGTNC